MRLREIQELRDGDPARLVGGHSEVDVNALGEPGAGTARPCACGAGCTLALDRPPEPCGGGVTVANPGTVAEFHLCATHLVTMVEARDPDRVAIELARLHVDEPVRSEIERAVRRQTWLTVVLRVRRRPNGDVEVRAECERCRAVLCGKTPSGDGGPVLTVAPESWDELAPPTGGARRLVPGSGDDRACARERRLGVAADAVAQRINQVRCSCSKGPPT